MEYRFQRDYLGNPVAQLSTEHEALGRWLNEELGQNTNKIKQLLCTVTELEQQKRLEFQLDGDDYRLFLTADSAEVKANLLDSEMMEDFHEDLDYYDCESSSQCGLDDFKHLISAWHDYLV